MLRPKNVKVAGVPLLLTALAIVIVSGIAAYRTWTAFERSTEQATRTRQVVDGVNALLSPDIGVYLRSSAAI